MNDKEIISYADVVEYLVDYDKLLSIWPEFEEQHLMTISKGGFILYENSRLLDLGVDKSDIDKYLKKLVKTLKPGMYSIGEKQITHLGRVDGIK